MLPKKTKRASRSLWLVWVCNACRILFSFISSDVIFRNQADRKKLMHGMIILIYIIFSGSSDSRSRFMSSLKNVNPKIILMFLK